MDDLEYVGDTKDLMRNAPIYEPNDAVPPAQQLRTSWCDRWFNLEPRPLSSWVGLSLTGIVSLTVQIISIHYFIWRVLLDDNARFKPVKGTCFSSKDMTNHICIFAVGQFSQGIICIGQINIGAFMLGQVGVALFAGVGQVVSGVGIAVGQLVSATRIFACQLGIGFYQVDRCQLGLQFLAALLRPSQRAPAVDPNNGDDGVAPQEPRPRRFAIYNKCSDDPTNDEPCG